MGAALDALGRGQTAMGLDNRTSVLHATREGKLRVTATRLSGGKRTHVWDAVVTDDRGRTVASGRVRMLCLDPGAVVAGKTVEVEPIDA